MFSFCADALLQVAKLGMSSGNCGSGFAEISAPNGKSLGAFDYIVTMEDLRRGQRIMNYRYEIFA